MTPHDAIVIGGGLNGLTAGAYLARAGKRVLVLERRAVLGGSSATEEFFRGFKVSPFGHHAGPFLARALRDLELPELPRSEGSVTSPEGLTILSSPEATVESIRRHSVRDAERYLRFNAFVSHVVELMKPLLTRAPLSPNGRSDLFAFLELGLRFRRLGTATMHETLRVLPMSSADFLNEWFESEPLKALLAARGLPGTFAAPRSPGTAALFLLWRAGSHDAPSPPGLVEALAGAVRRHRGEIRVNAAVRQVLVKGGRAAGVLLESGEELSSRAVLSSADPRKTFIDWIGPSLLPADFLGHVRNIRFRGAVAKVHLALDRLPAIATRGLLHVGPSLDAIERAFDDAKYGRFSARPLLEVRFPSLFDPSLAPQGKHVASILVQFAPYRLREGTWKENRDALGDAVLKTLAEHAPDLNGAILHRHVLTPEDLESTYGLPEGNLHHGEQTLDQLFFMRPVRGWARYSTPIQGLYLCGAGTHPGGAIAGASGFNAAREVLRNYQRQ